MLFDMSSVFDLEFMIVSLFVSIVPGVVLKGDVFNIHDLVARRIFGFA